MTRSSVLRALLALTAAASLASCGNRVFYQVDYIPPGSVGIRIDKTGSQREIKRTDLVVGKVTYNPVTTDFVIFPVTVQRVQWAAEEAITFGTGLDSSRLTADVGFSLRISEDAAVKVYTTRRKDAAALLQGEFHDIVRDALSAAGKNYRAVDVMGKKRLDFEHDALGIMTAKFHAIHPGIEITNFSLVGQMRADDRITNAIQQAIQAEQDANTERAKLAKVQAVNAQQIANTETQARQQLIKAEAAAKSRLVQAEAEATANRKIAASLTPELIKLREIEQWNGSRAETILGPGTINTLPAK